MKFRILLLVLSAVLVSGCAQSSHKAPAAPNPEKVTAIKELGDTRWTLSVLEGQAVAFSASGWDTPSLDFAADQQSVTGLAGVNRFGGRYAQDGAALTFGPLALTRRIGPAEQMDLESRYTRVLSGVTGWRQLGAQIELIADGKVGAVLSPVAVKK